MLLFKPVTIEDKEAVTAFTLPGDLLNCDYAFANMCSWNFLYESEYAIMNGFLFLRFYVEEKGRRRLAYMFPVGGGDLKTAIEIMENDAERMGYSLLMLGVTPDSKNKINALFPDRFTYIVERDYFDYIYLREELATLKGKRFQAKRNHINKFSKQYEYAYLPVTPDIICRCMEVEQIWCKANVSERDREDLAHERRSMTFAMNHFDELGLQGGAIVVDGRIIAFTYGSPINRYTFGIHVEKANVNYEGVFSVINREFASRIPEQYTYINREEDLGIPGLRQSKLSYNPVILLEKNAAVKRR
ncbi:MAG: phosphatidylglycerol lysyltransferase domain-containing protein [Tannerella sp.]|jgi:hypothetical protein|nr:phosphatidylglycerol lysyltransferase domain-containing protein [Tannerella sp.]